MSNMEQQCEGCGRGPGRCPTNGQCEARGDARLVPFVPAGYLRQARQEQLIRERDEACADLDKVRAERDALREAIAAWRKAFAESDRLTDDLLAFVRDNPKEADDGA